MAKFSWSRRDLVQVYEHCPRRPYVELVVPDDVLGLERVEFRTLSRDQGFCSSADSFTWFEVALRRPCGRSDIAPIKIHYNAAGNSRFQRHATRWDAQDASPRIDFWLRQVRPGDVIELVPKAHFQAWVNIVQEGFIEIEYQPRPIEVELPIGTLDISDKSSAIYSDCGARTDRYGSW